MATRETLLLEQIGTLARQLGLGEDGARVAQAIALTEGALGGAVGDNGQSYGPFQFHARGMLPSYAQSLGLSVSQAAAYARDNPEHAAGWALQGYLGQAIRDGQGRGLTGPALATYAQTYGQRSQFPERAGQQYTALQEGEPTKEAAMEEEQELELLEQRRKRLEENRDFWLDQAKGESDPEMQGAYRRKADEFDKELIGVLKDMQSLQKGAQAIDKGNRPPAPTGPVPQGYQRVYNAESNSYELQPTGVDVPPTSTAAKLPEDVVMVGGRLVRVVPNETGGYTALTVYEPPEKPPTPPTPPMSSPSAMMAAQEAIATGQFTRGPQFEWDKEKWGKGYDLDVARDEETRRQNSVTNEYNQARLAQNKLLREMEDRENWRRAQLSTAEGLYGTNANVFTKMAAAAPLPGQQYHLGYEPGGTMENIARLSGRAYNPESYRVGIQTFDPEEAWRRAQAMAGR